MCDDKIKRFQGFQAYRVVGAQRVESVGPAHEQASLPVQQHLHEVAALVLQGHRREKKIRVIFFPSVAVSCCRSSSSSFSRPMCGIIGPLPPSISLSVIFAFCGRKVSDDRNNAY